MTTNMNQKEYLKKYLSIGISKDKKDKKKKKKRKNAHSKSKGMSIIEDDADFKNIPFGFEDEDDAPTIAEITYEDKKIKDIEEFESIKNKWKNIQDSNQGFSKENNLLPSTILIDSDSDPNIGISRQKGHNSNSLLRGKRNVSESPTGNRNDSESPPRRKRNDSESPPRRKRNDSESPPRRRDDSISSHRRKRDDSESPPRRKRNDSESPPRKKRNNSESPPRRKRDDSISSHRRKRNDSESPPRRKRKDSESPHRRKRNDSDSPPRRKRNDSESPHERPRKYSDSPTKRRDDSISPQRKEVSDLITKSELPHPRKKGSNSYHSPTRKRINDSSTKRQYVDSPPRRRINSPDTCQIRSNRDDSDALPSRIRRSDTYPAPSPRRRMKDSDDSPPRTRKNNSVSSRRRNYSDASPPSKRKDDSDASPRRRKYSDASPPRRRNDDSDASPPRKGRAYDSDSSPPRRGNKYNPVASFQKNAKLSQGRPERTMTTAEYLKARKFGKLKKDTPEELERKKRESELQSKAAEAHKAWNKGVVQMKTREAKVKDDVHEMGKGLARYADDADMNNRLKAAKHDQFDPMLAYIRKKDHMKNKDIQQFPLYKGQWEPNRFNIRPGYRWDGFDRSSGFEKNWFNQVSAKKAMAEDSYKWSTEDM